MLATKNKLVEKEYTISNRTYIKQQFFGPYLDFIEKETEKEVTIELGRSYSEDSQYSSDTRLQLAVKLLYEVAKEHDKPIILKIWGARLVFSNVKDEFGIHQQLSNFILKNVSF